MVITPIYKVTVSLLLFFFFFTTAQITFGQENSLENRKSGFGVYHSSLINGNLLIGLPIDHGYQYGFMPSIGFYSFKERKKGGRWLIGNSFYFSSGNERKIRYITSYCGSQPEDVAIHQKEHTRINLFNLLLGYRFRPLNKKHTFFLKTVFHFGTYFVKWNLQSDPRELCGKNYDNRGNYHGLGLTGDLVFSHILKKDNRRIVMINYGGAIQGGYELYQICLQVGIELNFIK